MGESGQASGRAALQVGWVLDSGHATFLYDAPRRVTALGLRPGEGAEDDLPLTVLAGPVADQAALRGILNRLWDLNLTLISVIRVEQARHRQEDRL